MDATGKVVGILLAAGGGRRYGMPKALAEGGAWLAHGVGALAGGGCGEVLVVLGAADAPVPPPARAVRNPDWATGLGSSLRTGLDAARRTGAQLAVIHLVDLPDVGSDVVRRVVAAAGTTGLARATYDDLPGHPLAVHRRFWAELAGSAAGDRGGRDWLRRRDDLVAVPCADLATGVDRDRPRSNG